MTKFESGCDIVPPFVEDGTRKSIFNFLTFDCLLNKLM